MEPLHQRLGLRAVRATRPARSPARSSRRRRSSKRPRTSAPVGQPAADRAGRAPRSSSSRASAWSRLAARTARATCSKVANAAGSGRRGVSASRTSRTICADLLRRVVLRVDLDLDAHAERAGLPLALDLLHGRGPGPAPWASAGWRARRRLSEPKPWSYSRGGWLGDWARTALPLVAGPAGNGLQARARLPRSGTLIDPDEPASAQMATTERRPASTWSAARRSLPRSSPSIATGATGRVEKRLTASESRCSRARAASPRALPLRRRSRRHDPARSPRTSRLRRLAEAVIARIAAHLVLALPPVAALPASSQISFRETARSSSPRSNRGWISAKASRGNSLGLRRSPVLPSSCESCGSSVMNSLLVYR